jgi:hypothetical protein
MVIDILRAKTFPEKLEMMSQLHATARELAIAGLRQRFPGADPEELEARFFQLRLGTDLADRVLAARRARASRATGSRSDARRSD